MYPGTLAVMSGCSQGRRVSHSCQFSGRVMGANSIDLAVPVSSSSMVFFSRTFHHDNHHHHAFLFCWCATW